MAASTFGEALKYPLVTEWRKASWLAVLCLLPVLGPAMISGKLKYDPASGKPDHGEGYSGWDHSGDYDYSGKHDHSNKSDHFNGHDHSGGHGGGDSGGSH